MAYIGTSPSNGVRRVHTYTATANQTTFTGSSTEGVTLTYADTNYIDVFQNGVLLGSADYTSTSGTSVVLAQGASVSDLVVIVVYDVFSVADTVSKSAGGSFDGAITSNAGVKVDNITIDGTEIDLSSGDLTVDVAGDITLDAGGGDISFNKGGSTFLKFTESSSNGIINQNQSNADIIFNGNDGGNGIEAARFDMSERGAFCVGSTSIVGAGMIGVKYDSSSVHAVDLQNSVDASGSGYLVFRLANGSVIGQVARNLQSSNVHYLTSSDYRLKENVSYTFDATTKLKQLKPCQFNWIGDPDATTVEGFLAHEVQAVMPYAADGVKDATEDRANCVLNANGTIQEQGVQEEEWTQGKIDGKYASNTTWVASKNTIKAQSIDKSDIVPLLVKTIQELEARITALENAE